jgi:hypothetical protein
MHYQNLYVAILVLCSCLTGFPQTTNGTWKNIGAVAVFVQNGFSSYGGTPALPPSKMVDLLEQHGFRTETLSAAELADPAILNVKRVTVLVMPYGNAFPKSAFTNLRAFHARGGCLILNGVPFCHPCDLVNGKWKDMGHQPFFGHGPDGIGTGGFGGPMALERNPQFFIPGRPLGLDETLILEADRPTPWLDARSFPRGDEIIPLINVGLADEQYPGAALIRHHCAAFRGARDVWIGTVADRMEETDAYLAGQLLLRGVLWCEVEKGELTRTEFTVRLAKIGKSDIPKPLPYNLPFAVTPRPWGDSFLPKSKPPARHLLVVDAGNLNADERIALACLQGLTSREQPRIWINRGWVSDKNDRPYQDQTWLEWHKEKKYIDSYEVVQDWTSLFRQFTNCYQGAIIPDAKLYRGELLAVNVAACEDLIIATPELARKLGLPVKIDLRGKFNTYAEGMKWVWSTYKNQLDHHLCNYLYPGRLRNCAFAYDFQWRGVVFWLTGSEDQFRPGVDVIAENRVMAEILAEMDPNGAVLGYPWQGDTVGIGEGAGVAFVSRYAKALIPSDYLANTCVMSGVRVKETFEQPRQPATPALDRNAIYVALSLTDGDNLGLWMGWFQRYFKHPSYGTFPLAFGMGPTIGDICPAAAQWYFEHAAPNTEFFADVSGLAYTQPDRYGTAYADRDRVIADFLNWTAREMKSLGMRTARMAQGSDKIVSQYARGLPFCHSIMPDYSRSWSRSGIGQLTYALPEGTPVFRTAIYDAHGRTEFYRQLCEQIGERRPAFVNGTINCWDFSPDEIASLVQQKPADVVFVTPTQLAALFRQLPSYVNAREIAGRPGAGEGLSPVRTGDGEFTVVERAGVHCWLVTKHASPHYFYLDVDEGFRGGEVEIELEYFDTGAGEIALDYDSTDVRPTVEGAYKRHPNILHRTNTAQWQQARFQINDARFANRENGGSDFRFYNGGDDLLIRAVRVQRIGN